MPSLHIEKSRGKDGKEEVTVTEGAALPAWSADAAFAVVGKAYPRVEGAEKVTGRARYTYDIRLPGQPYARVLHNCMEPHGCTASWEGGNLTLWTSTQSVFDVRATVAQKLGLPEHRVRVIKQYMGGGFGSKQVAWKPDVIGALLAKMFGRPVQ